MSVRLSLVIPAFNEAERLPPYLAEVRRHLAAHYGGRYEVLVVDDGSRDGLAGAVNDLARGWEQLTLLCHPHNRGKGAAVRTGMLAARGEFLLFADADGATPIAEEAKLRRALERGADVAVGSRLVEETGAERSRVWRRRWCGRLFASLARLLLRLPLRDTQCGFKMFRREAGLRLFRGVRERGYLFDLEVLATADRLGYRIAEVPISWQDRPGSKIRLARDGWKMFRGLWKLRRRLGRAKARAAGEALERGAA